MSRLRACFQDEGGGGGSAGWVGDYVGRGKIHQDKVGRGLGVGRGGEQGERHVWEEVGGGRGLLGMKGGGGGERGERGGDGAKEEIGGGEVIFKDIIIIVL